MKKTLTVLASAVLALSMMFVMGCKQQAASYDKTEKTKAWRSDNTYGKVEDAYHLKISTKSTDKKIHSEEIAWWAVTGLNGEVLAKSKAVIAKDDEFVIDLSSLKDTKLKNDKHVVLWINQDTDTIVEENRVEYKKQDMTLRGKINLRDNKGVVVLDTKFGEVVPSVGILKLTCDETAKENGKKGCTPGKWHGTYDIADLLPLKQTNDATLLEKATFIIPGNLEYIGIDIAEGETKEVIWPSGEKYRVAIRQPARFNPSLASTAEKDKVTLNGNKITYKEYETTAKNKQENWYWSMQTKVPRSDMKEMSSSAAGEPFDGTGKIQKDDLKLDKERSIYDIVIIEGSDFIPNAANLK